MKNAAQIIVPLALMAAAFAALGTTAVRAQVFPMFPPVNTTIVISKPAPDQVTADEQMVTMGVGRRLYRFVLVDGYVDSTRIRWPDIWEQVRDHRPNFVVQGPYSYELERLRPGDILTVKAMFAPLDRTFEIVFTQSGRGPFEPERHY